MSSPTRGTTLAVLAVFTVFATALVSAPADAQSTKPPVVGETLMSSVIKAAKLEGVGVGQRLALVWDESLRYRLGVPLRSDEVAAGLQTGWSKVKATPGLWRAASDAAVTIPDSMSQPNRGWADLVRSLEARDVVPGPRQVGRLERAAGVLDTFLEQGRSVVSTSRNLGRKAAEFVKEGRPGSGTLAIGLLSAAILGAPRGAAAATCEAAIPCPPMNDECAKAVDASCAAIIGALPEDLQKILTTPLPSGLSIAADSFKPAINGLSEDGPKALYLLLPLSVSEAVGIPDYLGQYGKDRDSAPAAKVAEVPAPDVVVDLDAGPPSGPAPSAAPPAAPAPPTVGW